MDKTKYICSINQFFDKMKIKNYRRQDRQDRYLQNLGGVFFSHDSQLFGTDPFFLLQKHSGDSNSRHFPKMSSFYTPSLVHQKTISPQWASSSSPSHLYPKLIWHLPPYYFSTAICLLCIINNQKNLEWPPTSHSQHLKRVKNKVWHCTFVTDQ